MRFNCGKKMNSTRELPKVWSCLYDEGNADAAKVTGEIASSLGLSLTSAKILYNRGAVSVSSAREFLTTDHTKLHSPFLMKDMDKAVERILRAVNDGEKITVYGDYDVDGVTSVTLIYLYLKSIGANIDYYIPTREGEGYGLSVGAINSLKESGTKLIVTVDTGITAKEETDYAKAIGIDTVVTDHHECLSVLPEVCAVVNPHREDCSYPFSELAGVGVVFKLVCALEITRNDPSDIDKILIDICNRYADLAALGTVADVMPLCDENRAIVAMGLKNMSSSPRIGIEALMEASVNIVNARPVVSRGTAVQKKRKIDAGYIGFGIAPRINAAGRISTASRAVELLLSKDYRDAYERAVELCEINIQRQAEENKIAESAYAIVEATHDFENDKIIVVSGDNWHPGIIGIVASRVTEKYGLPTILISFDGAMTGDPSPLDIGKGSGRSLKGLNLAEGLKYCEDCLERYGGHELAAGLSVRRDRIDEFKKKINRYAKESLGDGALEECKTVDAVISLPMANIKLCEELSQLEPFGVSNPTPQFMIRDLKIHSIFAIGGGKHTKLVLGDGNISIQGVCFGVGGFDFKFNRDDRVDIICKLNINEFRNERTLQLVVSDIRVSEDYLSEINASEMEYKKMISEGSIRLPVDDIPTRVEIGNVYRLLREGMAGESIHPSSLYSLIASSMPRKISYIKMRFIFDILREIKVCGIKENSDGSLSFDVFENAKKTQLTTSPTFRMLTE